MYIKHPPKKNIIWLVDFGVDQPFFSPNSGNRLIFIHRATSKLETFQRTRVNGMAWMHRINPSHRGVFFGPIQTMHYYQGNPWKLLKITIHLHCSIPPQKCGDIYNLMTPEATHGIHRKVWSFQVHRLGSMVSLWDWVHYSMSPDSCLWWDHF